MGLGLLLSLDLGGLVSHLSGTGQRSVDLTSSAETEHQMEGGLLLNVVIGEGASVLELLSGEDQALLIWGNSLLVLNLSLHGLNGIGGLDVQSDGLSYKSRGSPRGGLPVRVLTKICIVKTRREGTRLTLTSFERYSERK